MSFFGALQEYRAYLRDNPKGYWFKRKLFGWGWTPARPQGWLVLAVFIALIVGNFQRIDVVSHSASDTFLNVIPQTILLIFVLLAICYKTGEKPRWSWGFPKKDAEPAQNEHGDASGSGR